MDQISNVVPANTSEEEAELKEGKDLLVRCKRTKVSGFIGDAQQGTVVSAFKDPMDVQSSGEANGSTKGHGHGISFTGYTGNESASLRLPKICTASGLKGPLYDFEEQGPPHNKLFTCKVTVHVDGMVNTVMECFGDPKHQKKVAQEHAAQGALWCLERFGYVK